MSRPRRQPGPGPRPEARGPRPPERADEPSRWYVYVLVSARARRTYVGVAIDVERRLRQHNGLLAGGARATRAGRPWMVGQVVGPVADRGRAQALEHVLKRRKGVRRLAAFDVDS